MIQTQKYLPLGSQKFTNGYLSICSDGFNFLRLWQMMLKIIMYFFVCVYSQCYMNLSTKKIFTHGVSKIYEWILRDTYRWVKVSKPLTDGG